jgi:hypothetical protein
MPIGILKLMDRMSEKNKPALPGLAEVFARQGEQAELIAIMDSREYALILKVIEANDISLLDQILEKILIE